MFLMGCRRLYEPRCLLWYFNSGQFCTSHIICQTLHHDFSLSLSLFIYIYICIFVIMCNFCLYDLYCSINFSFLYICVYIKVMVVYIVTTSVFETSLRWDEEGVDHFSMYRHLKEVSSAIAFFVCQVHEHNDDHELEKYDENYDNADNDDTNDDNEHYLWSLLSVSSLFNHFYPYHFCYHHYHQYYEDYKHYVS